MAFLHRDSTRKFVGYPGERGYSLPKNIVASFVGQFRGRVEPIVLTNTGKQSNRELYRDVGSTREEEEWRRLSSRTGGRKKRRSQRGRHHLKRGSDSPLFTLQEVNKLLRAQEYETTRGPARYVAEYDSYYRGRDGMDRSFREYYDPRQPKFYHHQEEFKDEDVWRDRYLSDFNGSHPSWARIPSEARNQGRYYQGRLHRGDYNLYDSY